jgi:hypothetical protein
MKLIRFLFIALLLCPVANVLAEDAPAPKPDEAQIKRWVSDLGADDFETREKAQKALIATGAPALGPVTEAIKGGDAEVMERGKQILDELQWIMRPDIADMAAIVPADAIFLLQSPSIKGFAETARKQTALGKLYDSAEAEPVKKAVANFIIESTGMSEAAQKMADTWVDVYGGPFGFSMMMLKGGDDLTGAMFGINAADKAKAYDDYCGSLMGGGDAKIERERFRGINIDHPAGHNFEFCALVKNAILRGDNLEAAKYFVNAVADGQKDRLSTAPGYVQAFQKIEASPLISFFFNSESLLKSLYLAADDDAQALKGLGFETWKHGVVGLYVKDDLFLERLFCKIDGERKGLFKMLSFGAATGAQAALCPPDALAFATLPVSGKDLLDQIATTMAEMEGGTKEKFLGEFAWFEELAGAKVPDLAAGVDGEVALWVSKPAAAALAAPDLTLVLPMKDAASAQKMSDAFMKFVKNADPAENVFSSADYKGRSLRWVKKEYFRGYDICWCADGSRVLAGSSPEAVQRVINRIDNKSPGLDSAADYKRLQALLKPEERGGFVYLNSAETFGCWLYIVGLPALTNMLPEAKRGAMPKDGVAIFKNLPGTLLSVSGTTDGVQAVSHGGLPSSGVFALFSTIEVLMFLMLSAH